MNPPGPIKVRRKPLALTARKVADGYMIIGPGTALTFLDDADFAAQYDVTEPARGDELTSLGPLSDPPGRPEAVPFPANLLIRFDGSPEHASYLIDLIGPGQRPAYIEQNRSIICDRSTLVIYENDIFDPVARAVVAHVPAAPAIDAATIIAALASMTDPQRREIQAHIFGSPLAILDDITRSQMTMNTSS